VHAPGAEKSGSRSRGCGVKSTADFHDVRLQ
jgi:hypothetical protein